MPRTVRFRLVQFVPDPFFAARVPMAALLTDGVSLVSVHAPIWYSAETLGSRTRGAVLRLAQCALSEISSFDVLPQSMGPHFLLDVIRTLPHQDITKAERFVREHILSENPSSESEVVTSRGPHRATFGRRFFETWGVDDLVCATFRPASDWEGRLARLTPYGEVSHWVAGVDSVLLMEPVVARPQISFDLRDLAKLFAAYRFALHSEEHHNIRFIAYLLPGVSAAHKEEVARVLADAHQIVDTEDEKQRDALLQEIRGCAGAVRQQGLLPAETLCGREGGHGLAPERGSR